MASSVNYSAMESPKGPRRPFGEITNNTLNNSTPSKEDINNGTKEQAGDPEGALTPLANLKMLIRVASETNPDGLLPPKRELFRENSQDSVEDHDYYSSPSSGLTHLASGLHMMQENFTPSPSSTSSLHFGPPKVSRKQKSLGLLCEKFMSRFPESVPEGEKCEIPLDDLAKQMSTERRRIYDIVNVLEAVQMMTKVGKNLYQWHGITHRIPTLAWLKQLALKLKMLERYNEVKILEESSENFYGSSQGSEFLSPNSNCGTPINGISPFSPSLSPTSSSGGPSPSPIERKTSLGVACQKFLMLFLIAPEKNAKVNLDFAARVIHGVTLPEAVMKTRIRRLYDIANILQSLQLIQKVQVTESNGVKKPAFQYIGPDVDSMAVDLSKDAINSLPAARQRNSLLAVGKNLLNIPDEDPADYHKFSSADLVKPLKKRFLPGFNFGEISSNHGSLTEKRPAPTSLLDLSKACEAERAKIRRTGPQIQPNSVLQSPIQRQSPIRQSPIRQSPIRSGLSVLQSPRSRSNSNLIRISPQNNIRRSHSHIISPIGNNSPMIHQFTNSSNHQFTNNSSNSNGAVTLLRKPLSPLTSLIRKPFSQNNIQKTVFSIMPPTHNGIMDLSKRKY